MENERKFKGIWIPKEIWEEKELSILEKVILVEIDSFEECFASNKYFADFFGLSTGRISQIINNLKNKGYINIDYQYKGKEIEKRTLTINTPPYPEVFNKLNRYLENDKGVFNKLNGGYLKNVKDNNIIYSNNTINNKNIYSQEELKQIIDYLNLKTNKHFKYTKNNLDKIKARLNEGFKLEEFKIVIDKKSYEWLKDDKMNQYLRPETLFGNKFESYLNQEVKKKTLNDISMKELEDAKNEYNRIYGTNEENINDLF